MRSVLVVALAVLVAVTVVVGPAQAVPTLSESDDDSVDGAGTWSTSAKSADEKDAGTANESDTRPPVSVVHRYALTPDEPGEIRFQATYRFDPNDSTVQELFDDRWISLDRNDTVVYYEGLDRIRPGLFEWDGESRVARLAVRDSVNVSGDWGTEAVDVGEWAFFDQVGYDRAPVRAVNGSYEVVGEEVTVGSRWGFIGDHDVRTTRAAGQRFRIVLPEAVESSVSVPDLQRSLRRSARQLDVAAKDDVVTAFVVTSPMRGGGAALDDEFWVTNPEPDTSGSTWHHEYVHTRQEFFPIRGADWTTEGFAEYYANLLTWRQGSGSFQDIRDQAFHRYGGRPDEVLANESTWREFTEYNKGSVAAAMLDYRIREATGGERTLADVFRRMNRHRFNGSVTLSRLESIAEDVAGREFDTFFDRYVRDGEFPGVPRNPALYEFAETTRIEGSVSADVDGRLSGTVVVGLDAVSVDRYRAVRFRPAVATTTYTTKPVSGSARVSLPVETGSDYAVAFFEYDDGETFPGNSVPDVYTLDGDVETRTGAGTFGSVQLPTAHPVDVTVYGPNGTPANASTPNGGVGVYHGNSGVARLSVDRGVITDAGRRSLDLVGNVSFTARLPDSLDRQAELRHHLSVTAPSDVHLVVHDSTPDAGIGGSAVVGSTVETGESVRVVAYPFASWNSRTVTVPVFVDGERVATRNVSIDVTNSTSLARTSVTISFDEPGTHRIRVGSLPAHQVTVEPADGSGSDDDTTTRRGHLSGGTDDRAFDVSVGDAERVRIRLSGPTDADFDLYATADGRRPTTRDYDARSVSFDSNESLVLDASRLGGTVGVLVDSFAGGGNFTLEVVRVENDTSGGSAGGYNRSGSLVGDGDGDSYRGDPGENGEYVVVALDGPADADFDLYVTDDGATPTTVDYDHASWSTDSEEVVVFDADELDGPVGVLVHSWKGEGNYTLSVWRTDDPPESSDAD